MCKGLHLKINGETFETTPKTILSLIAIPMENFGNGSAARWQC